MGALDRDVSWEPRASVGRRGRCANRLEATCLFHERTATTRTILNDPLSDIRADIRKAGGSQVLVETTAAAYGEGRGGAPMTDWKTQPIRRESSRCVGSTEVKSVGHGGHSGDVWCACGARIGQRTAQVTARDPGVGSSTDSVAALGAIVGGELSVKLDTACLVSTFAGLYASRFDSDARRRWGGS